VEELNAGDCIHWDAILRLKNIIFHGDCTRKAVWVFNHPGEAAPPEFPDEDTKELLRPYVFELVIQGSFKASELATANSLRSATGTATTPASTPSTQSSALRTSHLQNTKPQAQPSTPGAQFDVTAFPQPWDVRSIYSMFISAIDSLISYQLGKSRQFWPLDHRTFYTEHEVQDVITGSEDSTVRCPASIFTYSLYLTYTGTLILSCSSFSDSPIVRLSRSLFEPRLAPGMNLTSLPAGKLIRLQASVTPPPLKVGTTVVLSPGGLEAVLERDCPSFRPINASNEDSSLTQLWKGLVGDWLITKGIALTELEDSVEWTSVKVEVAKAPILWPRALCFCRREDVQGQASAFQEDLIDPAEWFRQASDGGYKDPLRAVEEWILEQPDRDKIREERKRRKEQEAAQKQAELQPVDSLSPFNARGAYADPQAVAGVYPTPPDGILSQTPGITGTSDMISTSAGTGAHGTTVDVMGGAMLSTPSAHMNDGGAKTSATDDEIFGGPDYDEMGGNDVTDADFSFFDQADDDEVVEEKQDSASAVNDIIDGQSSVLVTQSPEANVADTSNAVPDHEEVEAVVRTPQPEAMVVSESDALDQNDMLVDDNDGQGNALSPRTVQGRLFMDDKEPNHSTTDTKGTKRRSDYGPLEFNTKLKRSDTKYTEHGLFGKIAAPPSLGKRKRTLSKEMTSPPSVKRRRIPDPPEQGLQTKVRWNDDEVESSDDTSDVSDDDGFSSAIVTNGTSPRTTTSNQSRLRKQQSPPKENRLLPFSMRHMTQAIAETSTLETPVRKAILPPMAKKNLAIILVSTFEPHDEPPKPRARKLLSHPLPLPSPPNRSRASTPITVTSPASPIPVVTATEQRRLKPTDKSYIKIAQIVAEQIIFATFTSFDGRKPLDAEDARHSNPQLESLEAFRAVTKEMYPDSQYCDLLKYASIHDPDPAQINKNQPRPHPRRTIGSSGQSGEGGPPGVFNLRTPHVRVRRNDGLLDLLPPAIAFWETLGLAPTSGPKNVMSYCILPGNQDLKPQLMAFMDSLGATYESCKLGCHFRGECRDGVYYISPQKESYALDDMTTAYRTIFAKFGKLLAETNAAKGTRAKEGYDSTPVDSFVVYVFNPYDDPNAIKELCIAFWLMYQSYSQTSQSSSSDNPKPDIVLQILPMSCIASSSLVVPETSKMQRLAREVYDRCPPAVLNEDKSRLKIYSGPSTQLEEPVPKVINFKMTPEPPSDLLHDPSHIHVGYSLSESGNWITAAWTDSIGKYQATASYCLLGNRVFLDVAREIWQTTLEIMQARKVTWRISIARVGVPDREEIDAWAAQATSPSPLQVFTFLIFVDPNPPVSMFPKNLSVPAAQITTRTPVGTPQSGISPDTNLASTPAATPSEALQETLINDPDAHLVDVTDDTYAIIIGHRVNTSPNVSEYRPSMSSGFIVRPNALNAIAPPFTDRLDEYRTSSHLSYAAVHLLSIWTSGRTSSTSNPSPTSSQSSQTGAPTSTALPTPTAPQLQTSSSNSSALSDTLPPPSPATTGAPSSAHHAGQLGGSGNMLPKTTTDGLLRETMSTYRNLATLARLRGLKGASGGANETLPWHLLVAARGAEGLELVMGL